MKKVKIKYESHIFQNEYVDKYQEEIIGNLEQNGNETIISFLTNEKELTKLTYIKDYIINPKPEITTETPAFLYFNHSFQFCVFHV